MRPYSQDWTRKWGSLECPAVLLPKTTKQVAEILKHCNDRHIAVVPQVRTYMLFPAVSERHKMLPTS